MGAEIETDELLPVIVAELDDESARDMLEAVAFAEGEICVPLTSAPVDGSRHVLEVYTPDSTEPLLLCAHPLGPPTENGFLLRLAPFSAPSSRRVRASSPGSTPPPLRSRFPAANKKLTAGHTASLSPGAEATPSLVGRVLAAGKLRLDSVIGSGGMGVVYRATHLGLNMAVAVKVLHDRLQRDLDFCRRFHAEALAASRLDHQNLTRVLDFGQEADGLVYIAMEFLAGEDLRSVLARDGNLSPRRAAQTLIQVTLGLTQMHTRGMVHRDLKPDNVVLVRSEDEDGKPMELVKLCDFGIAVANGASGEIVGTPDYMSPEQCRGEGLDARADVYACGVMLFEMVTGRAPFEGDDVLRIVQQHLTEEPKTDALDPRVAAVVRTAMKKDPAQRYQSARDLRHALRELLTPQAAPPPLPPASRRGAAAQPDWLEGPHSSGHYLAAGPPSGQFAAVSVASRATSTANSTLQTDPTRFLSQLVQTTEPAKFAVACAQLEEIVPILAIRGHTATLWRVRSTLGMVAAEGPPSPGTRAASAARVLQLLRDGTVLAPAAEEVLRESTPSREARGLLLADGVAGAYALYAARAKATAAPEVRLRFVETLKEIGAASWPLLRAGLERLAKESSPLALQVTEDLLEAVPPAVDDAGGRAVSLHLRSPSPQVRRAAVAALARAWGQRARPLFVALLQDADEGVRFAVLATLKASASLDVEVVRRLALLIEKDARASAGLRTQAATALQRAAGVGRESAAEFLGGFVKSAPAQNPSQEEVLLAAAQSLVTIGGDDAGALVSARAAGEPAALRRRLLDIARAPKV
jgi:eukaryotic-like serine/threonine-protein kinase